MPLFTWLGGGSHGEYGVPTVSMPWEPRNDHGTMIITGAGNPCGVGDHGEMTTFAGLATIAG